MRDKALWRPFGTTTRRPWNRPGAARSARAELEFQVGRLGTARERPHANARAAAPTRSSSTQAAASARMAVASTPDFTDASARPSTTASALATA